MFDTEQSVEVICPSCGEPTYVWVETVDTKQKVVVESDCQVCCRPLHATIYLQRGQVENAHAEFGW